MKFQRNAVFYLQSVSMGTIAHGAFGVVQGLYILSLGFDETTLGVILSARMLAAAFFSLPAGIVSDRAGRKPVLLLGGLLTTVGYFGMSLSSSSALMIAFSTVVGVAQACQTTSGAPLLAESSTDRDRARLFGANFSLDMVASMVGSLLGGYLPQGFRGMGMVGAYRTSLLAASLLTFFGMLSALRIEEGRKARQREIGGSRLAEVGGELGGLIATARKKVVLGLLGYNLLIGFGAGLVIPYMSVFLAKKMSADSGLVGLILSMSEGATAIAGMIAPRLAERYGKVKTVVWTQVASIPFLLLIALPPNLGLVAFALFMRSALMNMSSPIAANVSMEIVDADQRGKVSSLMRIADNLTRSASAVVAGFIMITWGYELPYFLTAALYLMASAAFWHVFRGYYEKAESPELDKL